MKKNALKKFAKSANVAPNQFGAILENVDSKLSFLVESFSTLNVKFDKLDTKVDSNHEEFLYFQKNVIKRFDGIDKNFKIVFEYLSRMDDEIALIKKELKELKNKSNANSVESLEKRVKILEKSNMELRALVLQRT